jgi:DNA polymerase-3 subunit epsilon
VRTGRNKAIVCDAPCAPAQLGVACCPCRGHTAEVDYGAVVETVRRGLTEDPRLLLDPLERRMNVLAGQERFEEAAITRDRVAALTRVLRRRQTLAWLSSSGRMSVAVDSGVVTFDDGRLLLGDPELDLTGTAAIDDVADATADVPAHLDRRRADELLVVARWLDREVGAGRARLLEASGAPSSPRAGALPRYEPAPRRGIRRGR